MRYLYLLTFLFATTASIAQITWNGTKGPYGGSVQKIIVHPSTSTLYALGYQGLLFRSGDGGDNWSEVRPSVMTNDIANVNDISFTSDGTLWILCYSNLYKTADDGLNFAKVNSVTGSASGGFDSGSAFHKNVSSGTLYISGYHNTDGKYTVFRSTNNGVSWTKGHQSTTGAFTKMVSANNGNVYAYNYLGVFKSINDGAAFIAESSPSDLNSVTALTAKSDGSQINVITNASTTYSLSTPFTTWSTVTETGLAFPTDYAGSAQLEYTPDNSLLLLVDNVHGAFYSKTSAGTWASKTATFPSADRDYVNTIAAKDNTTFYAGGGKTGIWKTINAGTGWAEADNGLYSISSLSNMVVADNGAVLIAGDKPFMSTDKGESWSRPFTSTNPYSRYYVIKALTGAQPRPIVMLCDQSPTVANVSYKSTNNGSSWSTLPMAPAGRFATANGVRILSYENGTMYYTADQGSTWTAGITLSSLSGFPTGSISIYYVAMDESTIPVVYMVLYDYTSGSGVLKLFKLALNSATNPTSATVTNISLATVGVSDINDIAYYNNSIYILGRSGGNNVISITTNGGTSWTQKIVDNSTYDMDIDPGTGYIFLTRHQNDGYTVYVSRDGATSFTPTTISMTDDRTNVVGVAVDPVQGYAYAAFDNQVAFRTENTIVLPAAPTGLSSPAQSTDRVLLQWTDNATIEDDFVIEKQVGANFVEVSSASSNFTTGVLVKSEVGGLTANTSYTFRVAARNDAGVSAYQSVTVSTLNSCAQTIPDNRSWNGNINGSTALTDIGIVHKGNGLYFITDVTNNTLAPNNPGSIAALFQETCGQTYVIADYPLFANGNGTYNSGTKTLVLKWASDDDSPVLGTVTLTPNATDPVPLTPASLGVSVYDASSIEVTWTASMFATSYTIERSLSAGFASIQQTFTANYPATNFIDNTGLASGTTYFYRIKAGNASGASPVSAVVSTTFAKPMFALSGTPVETPVGSNTAGVFWGDFNNDGFDDLFITRFLIQPGVYGLPLMYKNNGAGGFTPVGIESGIEPSAHLAGSVADYDNDGKLDIFLASSGTQNYLYKGHGDFTFEKVATAMDANIPNDFEEADLSVTWVDVDSDGLVDIILNSQDPDVPIKYFKQTAAGVFLKQSSGDLATLTTTGSSNLWADYDNDGKQDALFVERSSIVANKLYKNNGDGSLDQYVGAFDADMTRSYGAAWGDYNNDGFLDVFIAGEPNGILNVLYKNASGTFSKQVMPAITDAKPSGVQNYGAVWADLNNDTFLDLVVSGIGGSNSIFISNNGTSFTKIQNEKFVDAKLNNFAVAAADYNRDGFIDLAISSLDPSGFETPIPSTVNNMLFKNLNTTGNWIEFRLSGTESNRSAIGARVILTAGGKTQIREVQSTTSFISQSSQVVHFGLGAATSITSIQIKWPSGIIQDVVPPAINTYNVITENDDPEPPVFANDLGLPATIDKSSLAQTLAVAVTDNKAVTKATMFVKTISGETFSEIAGTGITATGVSFALTASKFDALGIQYYFEAEDHAGNKARSPEGTDVYKTLVKYTGTDAQIPAALVGSGGEASGWKVIAVPFDLGSSNGVQTVFDELTGDNKIDYRLLKYTESPSPAWVDYLSGFSTIDRGVGYFINIRNPVTLVIGDGVVAPSNTRDDLFQLPLKAGWNMIGNPYLEAINWDNVVTYNTITGTGTTLKKFSGGSYSNATSIAAYEGGFVHMDADATVSVPFNGQTSGRIAKPSFGAGEWLVPIAVKQADITNDFGGVGMHSQASLSFDEFDDINAPHFIEFLEMNFSHPEHNARNFARDVVPVSNEFVWNFQYNSNIPGVATMTWDNETYSIGADLYLYDEDTQTPVNMKENSSYSFDANVSRNFKVYYGANALSKIKPAKVMLGLAYPNPTSNNATISFSIPERRGRMNVRLEIFDLTGRKVGTLASGEFEAGFYSAQWQPQDAANDGMYVYRLFAGDEVLGGKIILRK